MLLQKNLRLNAGRLDAYVRMHFLRKLRGKARKMPELLRGTSPPPQAPRRQARGEPRLDYQNLQSGGVPESDLNVRGEWK